MAFDMRFAFMTAPTLNASDRRRSVSDTITATDTYGQEITMAKSGGDNPFPLNEMMTQRFEQTRKAMESYLDFVEKNVKAVPWVDTDLTRKMKTFTEQNIATASEFAQKANSAKDFQDFWRIQTEFMQTQWKAFTEQTKELTELATKSATNAMKGSST
jgi:Phasin protein